MQDGSGSSVHQVQPPIIEGSVSSPVASASRGKPPALNSPVIDAQKHQVRESPTSPAGGTRACVATKGNVATKEHPSTAEEMSATSPSSSSSDVLEKARAAIAVATRASAAARAAAELAKVKITSQ